MVEIEKVRGMDRDRDFDVVALTGLERLAQEHGVQSKVYKEAQRVVSQWLSNDLQTQQRQQTTTLVMTPYTNTLNKRAVPVGKIDAVSDFQLLFWTGVFLVLITFGILTFVYQLGNVDSGSAVLTSTALPKQD